jgi:DNA-binding transcriptional LysR family regulator
VATRRDVGRAGDVAGGPHVQSMDQDLRRLRCFVTVADVLHFRRAAASLSMSGPALTQQINRLESDLDCLLFERTSRRVRLSEAGTALLPLAREVLAASDRLGQWATGEHRPPASTLRVGFSPTAPGALMRPFLRELTSALQPHYGVAIHQYADHEPCDALHRQEVHAVFARDPFPHEGIRARVILIEPRVAVLPRDHRLAGAASITLADLADEVFVTMPCGMPQWSDHSLGRPHPHGGDPRLGPSVSSFDEMRQQCALNACVGIAPASVGRLYAHPQIAYVRLADVEPTRVMLCTQSGAESPALGVLEAVARRVVVAVSRTRQAHAAQLATSRQAVAA